MNLLPIWQQNKSASFIPTVDSNEVLSFVQSIRNEQRWTYAFAREADIFDVLKTQISGQLKDLLELRRKGHFDVLELFRAETHEIQRLVRTRPRLWEYDLTYELLAIRTGHVEKQMRLIEEGKVLGSHKSLKGREYLEWVSDQFPEMIAATELLKHVFEQEIVASWGPPGVSGKPEEILAAADHLQEVLLSLVELESQAFRTHGPEAAEPVREVLLGMTDEVRTVVLGSLDQLREFIALGKQHKEGDPPLVKTIDLKFEFAKGKAFTAALAAMKLNMTAEDWA